MPKRTRNVSNVDEGNIRNNKNKNGSNKKRKIIPKFEYSIIETLDDLIGLYDKWEKYKIDYNIKKTKKNEKHSLDTIGKIIQDIRKLNGLVGLTNFKKMILKQILFFCQNLHSGEMMHTVIYGDQGCGKTTIGEIMANIYSKLGILSKGTFKIARRSDFIAGYLGQTALKTKALLDSCLGGVLFIDEAYSLGPNRGDKDSFSKEFIDTLNQFLSEHSDDFICIIAGYKESLEESIFSKNRGLDRRFPWRYETDRYSNEELYEIFKNQFVGNWKLNVRDVGKVLGMFDSKILVNNGGDCRILFDKCKIEHGRRLFSNPEIDKFVVTDEDIELGYNDFIKTLRNGELVRNDDVPFGLYI